MATEPLTAMRACRKCGIEKPLARSHFQNTNGNPNTFRNVCTDCRSQQRRERLGQSPAVRRTPEERREINKAACRRSYHANRDERLRKMKEYREENREAVLAAQRRYYRENIKERKAADKAYREANREKRAEAHRKWSLANPDRIAFYNKRYQQSPEGKENQRQRGLRWRKRYADRIREDRRRWYRENAEAARAYQREYYAANRERFRELARAWREENKAKLAAWSHYRRVATNTGEMFTGEDVEAIFDEQDGCCAYCEADLSNEYEVDHFIPIAQGGGNEPENIILACMPCNRSKGAKMPWEWRPDLFRAPPDD